MKRSVLIPNSEIEIGRTADLAVPSGHWPEGTGKRLAGETDVEKSSEASSVPSGESPLGTGRWPVLPAGMATAISEGGLKVGQIPELESVAGLNIFRPAINLGEILMPEEHATRQRGL